VITEKAPDLFQLDAWDASSQVSLTGRPIQFPTLEAAQAFAERLLDYRPKVERAFDEETLALHGRLSPLGHPLVWPKPNEIALGQVCIFDKRRHDKVVEYEVAIHKRHPIPPQGAPEYPLEEPRASPPVSQSIQILMLRTGFIAIVIIVAMIFLVRACDGVA
jgi:hypothetical protein